MLFRRPFWFRLLRTRFRRKKPAIRAHHGPIWGQSACGELPLGRCAMAKNGCEIIAVYNALRFLGRAKPLEALIAREVNPEKMCVLTVGKFQAGSAANIIPEEAVLEGTIRTNDVASRALLVRRLKEVA